MCISVTLLLKILHLPVLHPLLDPLLVLLRGGGAAGVQRVVGPVHVGGLLGEVAHPAVLPGAGVAAHGGQHLGLVVSMLGKERVNGLITHGWVQFVSGALLSISIVIVILILKACNVVIGWSKLTKVSVARVGVSEGDSADDVIMTIVLVFILTLGVGMTAAILEPVSRSSGYALARPRSISNEIFDVFITVHGV